MKIARALFLLAPLGLAACGDPEFGSDFDGPIEAYFDQDPEQFTEVEYRLVGKVLGSGPIKGIPKAGLA